MVGNVINVKKVRPTVCGCQQTPELSFYVYGTFAPGNERSIELSPPGAKVPRMKLSLQGVKVPRSESSCYLWPCAALYLLQWPDGLACGDQRRLTGNGSALEVVPRRCAIQIHDFTLLYVKLRYRIRSVCIFANWKTGYTTETNLTPPYWGHA